MKSNNLTSIVTNKNLFDIYTCQAFVNALTTSDVHIIFSSRRWFEIIAHTSVGSKLHFIYYSH